jgi:hypothetical protein
MIHPVLNPKPRYNNRWLLGKHLPVLSGSLNFLRTIGFSYSKTSKNHGFHERTINGSLAGSLTSKIFENLIPKPVL